MTQRETTLLTQLGDPAIQFVDSYFLKDPYVVQAVLRRLQTSASIQATALSRIHVRDIAELIHKDVVHEEMLIFLFQKTEFPIMRIIEILRVSPFESRRFILEGLRAIKFKQMKRIDEQINVSFDLIHGVLVEHIDKTAKSAALLDQLESRLVHEQGDLNLFKQYAYVAAKTQISYISWVMDQFHRYASLYDNCEQPIQNKEEFETILKLLYVSAMTPSLKTACKKNIEKLSNRIHLTLLQYTSIDSVYLVLQQLPESIALGLLRALMVLSKEVTHVHYKHSVRIKKGLEAHANKGKFYYIRKLNRRHKLGYAIPIQYKE